MALAFDASAAMNSGEDWKWLMLGCGPCRPEGVVGFYPLHKTFKDWSACALG
jgi:hypothetical protein